MSRKRIAVAARSPRARAQQPLDTIREEGNMAKQEQHLVLRSRDGDQALGSTYKSAETALSLAITKATRHESKEGSWTILEWGQPVYRVTKDEHGDCQVEVIYS